MPHLPMGSIPDEEYFPCAEELEQLEKYELALYETYSELMCHFCLCLDLHPSHRNTNILKVWAEYLFPVVGRPLEDLQALVEENRIAKVMKISGYEDVVFEEDNDAYDKGDTFFNFLSSSWETSIPKGFVGWLFISPVEEMYDPLSTP